MRRTLEELYQKFSEFHEKFNDPELDEYLLGLGRTLEESETMHHQFAYLLMHIRATVAHQVRPKHLQDAVDRAERFLKKYDSGEV